MTGIRKPVSAMSETLRSGRWMTAATLALALLPSGAFAMDSTPRQAIEPARALSLPPVRYLESMRWMDWKPAAPVFKVDTLLLPGGIEPGIFRLPSDQQPDLPSIS